MIGAQATVDQGLDQEWVPIGTELDAISVENMTISQKIVLHQKRKERYRKSSKCLT